MEPRWAGGLLLNTHLQPRTCDLHTERRDWTSKHDGVNSLVDNTSIWHFLNTSTKTSSSPSPRHSCRWDVMEEQMKHQCESPVFTAFKHSSLTLTLTLWHSLSLYLLYFALLVPFCLLFSDVSGSPKTLSRTTALWPDSFISVAAVIADSTLLTILCLCHLLHCHLTPFLFTSRQDQPPPSVWRLFWQLSVFSSCLSLATVWKGKQKNDGRVATAVCFCFCLWSIVKKKCKYFLVR